MLAPPDPQQKGSQASAKRHLQRIHAVTMRTRGLISTCRPSAAKAPTQARYCSESLLCSRMHRVAPYMQQQCRHYSLTSTCRPPAARAPAQARCCSDRRSRGPFTSDSFASLLSAFQSSRSGIPPVRQTRHHTQKGFQVRLPEDLLRITSANATSAVHRKIAQSLVYLTSPHGPLPAACKPPPAHARRCSQQSPRPCQSLHIAAMQ